MGHKSTAAEVARRVDQIVTCLINGLTRSQMIQYGQKQGWGVGPASIDQYIASAKVIFAEIANTKREVETGKALARYDMLFARNMQVSDFRTALASEKARCELLGLNAPKRQELTGANGGPLHVADARQQLLDRLKAQDQDNPKE